MKRFLSLTAALIIAGLCLGAQANAADLKIAYMDARKVLSDSAAGKEVLAQLEKVRGERQKEIDKMQDSLKKMNEEMQVKGPTMKEAAKLDLQSKIESEMKSFNRYAKDAEEEMRRKEYTLTKPLYDELQVIITDYGKKNAIDLIIDVKTPGIHYNSEKGDITNDILKAFDAKNPKAKGKK